MNGEPKNYGFLREYAEQILGKFGVRNIQRYKGYMLKTAPVILSGVPNPPFGYEPACAVFLRAYLRTGDRVGDIGAGAGALGFIAAAQVQAAGRVVSVEAHPRVYDYLLENISLNGFQNMMPVRTAVAEKSGSVRVTDFRDFAANRICGSGASRADAQTLDGVLWRLEGEIALVCLSLNGYECNALSGGAETLLRTRALCLEMDSAALNRYGGSFAAVRKQLESAGFKLCSFEGETLTELPSDFTPGTGAAYYYAVRDRQWCNARLGGK